MFGYYYRAYEGTNPPIVPLFNTGDYVLYAWMKEHIPHHWRKNAMGGHFYQQHNVFGGRGEARRQDTLKYQADGWAMLSRDEMDKTPYSWGIWKEAPQWGMYWSGLHALYFGIDFWNIERLPPWMARSSLAFSAFGAAQDPDYEPAFDNKSFQLPHLNDVGWNIVHGNYRMYLTQHWRSSPRLTN